VSAAGRKAIAIIKNQLNDYTVASMRCAPDKIATENLKKTLAGFFVAAEPSSERNEKLPKGGDVKGHATEKSDSGKPSYGGELAFDVRALSPETVGIVARIGIACGDDAMLMLFERRNGAWAETLRTQSAPYKTVAGGWWSFDYGVSPRDKDGHWFVVVKNIAPWCSSTWSEIRYAVVRPG